MTNAPNSALPRLTVLADFFILFRDIRCIDLLEMMSALIFPISKFATVLLPFDGFLNLPIFSHSSGGSSWFYCVLDQLLSEDFLVGKILRSSHQAHVWGEPITEYLLAVTRLLARYHA